MLQLGNILPTNASVFVIICFAAAIASAATATAAAAAAVAAVNRPPSKLLKSGCPGAIHINAAASAPSESRTIFERRCREAARPCLIHGAVDHWTGLKAWSSSHAEEFVRQHSDLLLPIRSAVDVTYGAHQRFATGGHVRLEEWWSATPSPHMKSQHLNHRDESHSKTNSQQQHQQQQRPFIFAANATAGLVAALRPAIDLPPLVHSVARTPIFSLGSTDFSAVDRRGPGLALHQHTESWLAMVSGTKHWFLHRPTPTWAGSGPAAGMWPQTPDALAKLPGVRQCIQRPGEILYLPPQHWHATFNVPSSSSNSAPTDEIHLAVGGLGHSTDAGALASHGDISGLAALVAERGAGVLMARNERGEGPLHVAANARVVEWLLDNTPPEEANNIEPSHSIPSSSTSDRDLTLDPIQQQQPPRATTGATPPLPGDFPDLHGDRPIQSFALRNDAASVALLLGRGAKLADLHDAEELTLLHNAAAAGACEVVKLLVNLPAENPPESSRNSTSDPSAIRMPPSLPVDVRRSTGVGPTPLMLASFVMSVRTASVLVAHGADIHASDAGKRVVHYAAAGLARERVDSAIALRMFTFLKQHGARFSAKTSFGKTAADEGEDAVFELSQALPPQHPAVIAAQKAVEWLRNAERDELRAEEL